MRDSLGSPGISEMSESNTGRKTLDDASVLCEVTWFSGEDPWTSR